jgi:hypothetical protein
MKGPHAVAAVALIASAVLLAADSLPLTDGQITQIVASIEAGTFERRCGVTNSSGFSSAFNVTIAGPRCHVYHQYSIAQRELRPFQLSSMDLKDRSFVSVEVFGDEPLDMRSQTFIFTHVVIYNGREIIQPISEVTTLHEYSNAVGGSIHGQDIVGWFKPENIPATDFSVGAVSSGKQYWKKFKAATRRTLSLG